MKLAHPQFYCLFFIVRLAEIGIGLTGFGAFFLFLGVVFLFDKGLLAIGNVSGKSSLTGLQGRIRRR